MYKNQLQELAQRSCFNLPAYACMREGPDHAPRFKATVNFNGELFQSPGYSHTLRQAEHSAAEVALNLLSSRGSKSLTARVLDETGVYKNLLQETAHKAGLDLPAYTTIRSGPGHVPIFTCTVELAGLSFTGDSAKTKKQAEKNAAISAWSSLKKMPSLVPKKESLENHTNEEEEEEVVRRVLSNFRPKKSGKQKDHHHNNYLRRSRNARFWKPDYPLKYHYISNTSNIYNNNRPWKPPSEFALHNNSFVDLLPPPPPRTTSKILPLTSKNNIFYKEGQNGSLGEPVSSNLNTTRQDILPHHPITISKNNSMMLKQGQSGNLGKPASNNLILDQGQNGKVGEPVLNKANASLEELGQTYIRNMFFGPSSCGQRGNMVNYNGLAQAVQIRSIIPVCASPPNKTSSLVKPFTLNPSQNPISESISGSNSSSFTAQLGSTLGMLELND